MVSRDPAQGDTNSTSPANPVNPATGTGAHGHGYNRQPGDSTTVTGFGATDTYSPHADVSGYAASTEVGGTGETDQTTGVKDKVAGVAGSAASTVSGAAGTAKERATEMAGTARERVGDVAGTATQTLDAQRDTVAGSLDTVATTLRDRAEQIPGGEKTTVIAQTAADKIETASSYLREREVSDMMTDVETFVRSHPTESLVLALAAGFLLGRAVRG